MKTTSGEPPNTRLVGASDALDLLLKGALQDSDVLKDLISGQERGAIILRHGPSLGGCPKEPVRNGLVGGGVTACYSV